jgi:hypothetical protein
MTGMDVIALTPWVFFGAALAVVCLRLRRSRRPSAPPHPPEPPRPPAAPPGQRADRQEAPCPEKNLPPRP